MRHGKYWTWKQYEKSYGKSLFCQLPLDLVFVFDVPLFTNVFCASLNWIFVNVCCCRSRITFWGLWSFLKGFGNAITRITICGKQFWMFCWFYGLYWVGIIKTREGALRGWSEYLQSIVKINREWDVVIWTNSGIIVPVELTNFICLRSSVAFCYQISRQHNWNYYLVVIRENLNCCLFCSETKWNYFPLERITKILN